jgi:uncharacterized protein YciI
MVTVALCPDAAGSSEPRLAGREAHLAHLEALGEDLLLAAPLVAAGIEGAFAGSLFVFAGDADAARSALVRDPYHEAGVWTAPSLFATESRFGMWMPERGEQLAMFAGLVPGGQIRPADPADRHYLFLCHTRETEPPSQALQIEHGTYIAQHFKRMMFGARLVADGGAADAPHGLYIFRARDLPAAQTLADAEPYVAIGHWRTHVFAMPALLGGWPRTRKDG